MVIYIHRLLNVASMLNKKVNECILYNYAVGHQANNTPFILTSPWALLTKVHEWLSY